MQPLRASSGLHHNFTRCLHGVLRRDSQIIGHYPKPPGASLIAVGRNGPHRDAALARYADVRRRLLISHANVDLARSERLDDRLPAWILSKLDPYRNTVAMKDWGMDNAH